MDHKFKILSKKLLFESHKFKIESVQVELPNGKSAEWDVNSIPDTYAAVPIKDGIVYMTKEWRTGPEDFLTQFTIARCEHNDFEKDLCELKREVQEELGIIEGNYEKIVTHNHSTRVTGKRTSFLVQNFTFGETNRDEDEFQEIIKIPIKGLYNELYSNHIVTAETLLVAKLLEERFN